jgi:hypothetical protein
MAVMIGTFTSRTAETTPTGPAARPASRVAIVAGGAVWIVATLQYAIVQIVAAAAWHHPPYNWLHRRLTTVALILWIITGAGKIAVGLVPENTNINLHLLAAFNIPVGCVAILLLSLSIRHISRAVSVTGTVLAVIGLAGTALYTTAEFAGSSLYLGLGAGGMERVADYPGSLWLLMIGIIAVLSATTRRGRRAAGASVAAAT